MKKTLLSIVVFFSIINCTLSQHNSQVKLNLLPLVLNGYGASFEQRVFKDFAIELGYTTFDRISLKLAPSIPVLKDPFREAHIYLNFFRNIRFAPKHYLQFGTQFNLYSRAHFSEEFIQVFENHTGEKPNKDKLFVTSILLGYKMEIDTRWNVGFQLGYNLRDKTDTQSAFSVTVGYSFHTNIISRKIKTEF